jgi:2-hydroxy-3-keto-5-methylthiopentenyl-1-phosphate phosphatase
MYSVAYDTQVSAMYIESLKTANENRFEQKKSENDTIIKMLSKIITQNEEIKEKLSVNIKLFTSVL